MTIDEALEQGGTGRFQRRLLGIFGLVWAADAMQVIAAGFAAASIAATFDLDLPAALQTATAFFLGMFAGAFVFGRIADRWGRRRVLIVTVAADAVFGIASAFAPDFTMLIALRFLTGAAVGGTLPVDYAMMAEFLPPSRRGRWLVFLEGFWAVGTIAIALTAWAAASAGVAEPWRVIFLAASVPAVIGIFLRLWVPESPQFLLRRGDEPAARAVVARVLAANGTTLPADTRLATPAVAATGGILSPALRRVTLTMAGIWFLVSLSYYGVFTWMPARLAKDGFGFVRGYGFLVLVALAQVPGYALAAWWVERLGRLPTLRIFLLLSAAGCLMFTLAPSPAIVAAALLLMSFALLGTWGALYALTPELYPTPLRGTGMGTASAIARLGGLAAPTVLAFVVARGFGVAVGLFAVALIGAAMLSLALRHDPRGTALR